MTALQAMWVHGTAIQPERQGFFVNSIRQGRGALFQSHNEPGKGGEWFHIAVPTPVLVNGARASAAKVLIRYATVLSAKITAVHLYDGEHRFQPFEGLSLASKADSVYGWSLEPTHEMLWGLGISVFVDFGPPSDKGVPGIWFRSAGADFQVL